jgi:hypothetical protein
MLNHLDSLYDLSSKAFWEALTIVAKNEWRVVNE